MTIQQIVKCWLIDHKYDGLYGEECGCTVDDLMPCGEPGECEAGYRTKCNPETCSVGGGCDWHIAPDRKREQENIRAAEKEGGPT
jgi:hypothetical protein